MLLISLKSFTKLAGLLVIAAVLSACAGRSKQAQETSNPLPETSAVMVDGAVRLNNVSYTSVLDLAYQGPTQRLSYGPSSEEEIWYWHANADMPFAGVVILIHGGCWLSQFDISHTQAMSSALADAGFAVWNIEYRRSGNGGEWPIALDDIQRGIAHLVNTQSALMDLSKIHILGHSAGGHLALRALGESKIAKLLAGSRIKLVGLAPIVDISSYAQGSNSCQTAAPAFMGGMPEEQVEKYQAANVLNIKFANTMQVHSLAGGKDTIVPVNYTLHPQAASQFVEQAGHFDWIHPGTDAFNLLLSILKDEPL